MSNIVDFVKQAYFYTNLPINQSVSFNINSFSLPNFLDNEKISKDIDLFSNSKDNYFLNFEVTYYFSNGYNNGAYLDVSSYTFPIILSGEFFKGSDLSVKRQEFNRVIKNYGDSYSIEKYIFIKSTFTYEYVNDKEKRFVFKNDIKNITGSSLYLFSIVYTYKGLSKVKK